MEDGRGGDQELDFGSVEVLSFRTEELVAASDGA